MLIKLWILYIKRYTINRIIYTVKNMKMVTRAVYAKPSIIK